MKRSHRALLEELRNKRARRRRRFWLTVLVLLLLMLLLLLRNCSCASPPEPEPEPPVAGMAEPVVVEPGPAPLTGRMDRLDRPTFGSDRPKELPWIASFRMQVAARGPRLAACFVGAPRPGALKWTASVEPGSGLVSDHELEPTLGSDDLTTQQRACVLDVLSDPPYRLETDGERSTPSRVGMAIEF